MELLNRVALLVRPKRRYAAWTVSVATGDDDPVFDLEEARLNPSVYLVAARDDEHVEDLIDDYAATIFEAELASWHTDEADWPVNRSPHVFRDWFDVTLGTMVRDVDPEEPLDFDREVAQLDPGEMLDALRGDPDGDLRCAWCATAIAADARISAVFLKGPRAPHDTAEVIDLAVAGRVVPAVVPSDGSEAAVEGVTAMVLCCTDHCAVAVHDAWNGEHVTH